MKPSEYKLENDLDVLFVPQETSLSVTVMILVRVGSRYEDKNEGGIAHFVEHMFFKGTEKRPTSRHIGMDIEKIGGSSNAFTSEDYTGYYVKVPKEEFEKSIEILSDMIKNGKFEQDEINKERGVIIEEIKMYEDRPMSKVSSVWETEFYGDTPLGRDIAGTINSVSNLNREHFLNFVKRNYNGENVVLAIAGGIKEEEAFRLAEKYFKDLKKGEKGVFEEYVREEKKARVVNLQKPLEQSHLMLGCYSFPRSYENKYVIKVAQAILSQGFSSRLFQVIRDQLGLAYYIYSRIQSHEEIGSFVIGMGVENSKIKLAVEAVMKEFRSLIEGDFDDEELYRAKHYLIGNMVTDLESSDDFALWYGLQKLLLNKIDTVEYVKEKIYNVTREQILDEMKKVFSGQELLLTSVTPHAGLDESIKDLLVL